ncbi:hypothetical protein [Methanococcoides alaskense]|nr:hypothetical protein [Methanococcoides alaskense]
MISLREVLSWKNAIPSEPPIPKKTILISGLETVIETMSQIEADEFLSRRIRPLLIQIQNSWTDCGIVFGFSSHKKAFSEVSLDEEVHFHRRDKKTIRLSEGLWDGSATMNMKRITRDDAENGKEITVGYYVARIS